MAILRRFSDRWRGGTGTPACALCMQCINPIHSQESLCLEFLHFLFSTTPAPPRHPSSSEEGSR
jgi:hypothetical protein